jgi:hypothetical protein
LMPCGTPAQRLVGEGSQNYFRIAENPRTGFGSLVTRG